MQKFVSSKPDSEIIGQALLALETSILNTEFADVLTRYELSNIQPEKWYNQQQLLNVHRELIQGPNGSQNVISIGVKIVDSLPFSPDLSLEQALQTFSGMHQQVHRNITEEDQFIVRKMGERHFEIVNSSPFPDELIYGYVYALMNRFRPQDGQPVLVYRDPAKVNSDEAMIFDLTW